MGSSVGLNPEADRARSSVNDGSHEPSVAFAASRRSNGEPALRATPDPARFWRYLIDLLADAWDVSAGGRVDYRCFVPQIPENLSTCGRRREQPRRPPWTGSTPVDGVPGARPVRLDMCAEPTRASTVDNVGAGRLDRPR